MNKAWKNRVDSFLCRKWPYLMECATNICRSKKTSAGDLAAELSLFLYENESKLEPYNCDDRSMTAFSVSWMKLQSQYPNTPFNRRWQHTGSGEAPELASTEDPMPEDPYIADLRTQWTDEQVENILKIHDIYPTLSEPLKVLFKAYFLEGLSYEKIKDKYHFFRTDKKGNKIYYKSKKSIFNLMAMLKEEIKSKL